jgi:hypothetical protein
MKPPKADLAIVLGGGPKKPAAAEESASYDEDLQVVAGDLIAAVQAGDAAKVASALKAAHSICSGLE